MLTEKLHWMKDSDNIADEIRQCKGEGRQIEDLLPACDAVLKMDDSPEKEKRAAELLLEMEGRPVAPDFPYDEPELYEDIQKTLKGKTICRPLPEERRFAAIKGAWTGRAAGCLLGIPVEGWPRKKIRDFLNESGQYPLRKFMSSDVPPEIRDKFGIYDIDEGMSYDRQKICWINNMDSYPVDDDMNYTMLSLRVTERCGVDFSAEDVAESWLLSFPALHACTAERVAYRNLMHRILPPYSGIHLNPFREWIGAQIRVDFYGYIAAGNPALAAKMAYRDASVAQSKNGIYAAMYIAALIASAAVIPDYAGAVREALKQVPPESRLYCAIEDMLSEYESGVAFGNVIDRVHAKYDEKKPFDWCLAIPNALIVTACALYFGNNYTDAISNAVLSGFDTDCNGATVGSIVGLSLGIDRIEPVWETSVRPVLNSTVCGYTKMPVDEAVERTLKIMSRIDRQNASG